MESRHDSILIMSFELILNEKYQDIFQLYHKQKLISTAVHRITRKMHVTWFQPGIGK